MATISFTISTASATELNDAVAFTYGYQPTIDGAPNPETKTQFSKRMTIEKFFKDIVKSYRREQALLAVSQVDPDIQ